MTALSIYVRSPQELDTGLVLRENILELNISGGFSGEAATVSTESHYTCPRCQVACVGLEESRKNTAQKISWLLFLVLFLPALALDIEGLGFRGNFLYPVQWPFAQSTLCLGLFFLREPFSTHQSVAWTIFIEILITGLLILCFSEINPWDDSQIQLWGSVLILSYLILYFHIIVLESMLKSPIKFFIGALKIYFLHDSNIWIVTFPEECRNSVVTKYNQLQSMLQGLPSKKTDDIGQKPQS